MGGEGGSTTRYNLVNDAGAGLTEEQNCSIIATLEWSPITVTIPASGGGGGGGDRANTKTPARLHTMHLEARPPTASPAAVVPSRLQEPAAGRGREPRHRHRPR